MKELKKAERIYLEEFDINVDTYLSLSDIMNIVHGALGYSNLVERDVFIAMVTLQCATDISENEIDALDEDLIFTSGLVDAVVGCIANYNLIDFYINKYEGMDYKIAEFIEVLNQSISDMGNNMPDLNNLINELGKLQNVTGYRDN